MEGLSRKIVVESEDVLCRRMEGNFELCKFVVLGRLSKYTWSSDNPKYRKPFSRCSPKCWGDSWWLCRRKAKCRDNGATAGIHREQ